MSVLSPALSRDINSILDEAEELYSFNGRNRVVWLGIDSLTDGAGGKSYVLPLEKFARGAVGWGGRWVPFSNARTTAEAAIYKSGFDLVEDLPWTDQRKQLSLDGYGAYAAASANVNFQLKPDFDWIEADVYYLQQPSGATAVDLDRPHLQNKIVLDTSGPLEVKKVTVINEHLDGSDAGGSVPVTTATNAVRFVSSSLDGDLCIFGVMFKSGNAGPAFVSSAKGGRLLSEHVQLDTTQQRKWFADLGITDAIINAGMNDRTTRTPAEFEADLRELCGRFSGDVNQLVVRPHDPSDLLLDQYDDAYAGVASDFGRLLDTTAIYGKYSDFTDNRWMLDAVHTNEHFQYHWAQVICQNLFGRCVYEETPPLIDYLGGDSQGLIRGSFKHVLAELEALDARVTALEP